VGLSFQQYYLFVSLDKNGKPLVLWTISGLLIKFGGKHLVLSNSPKAGELNSLPLLLPKLEHICQTPHNADSDSVECRVATETNFPIAGFEYDKHNGSQDAATGRFLC
jgi:hypothetical protein